MTNELILSTVLITLALVLYSIGVWSERFAGKLKWRHLVFFWSGLLFDTTGTGIMFEMAGGMGTDIHSVTGLAAIILMLIHAIWATAVMVSKNKRLSATFTILAFLYG